MRTVILLCCLLLSGPSAGKAGEVYAEPTWNAPRILEAYLAHKCAFALGNAYHRFLPGHHYAAAAGDGERMDGTWQIDGDDLVVSAEGRGRRCDPNGLEPCEGSWTASFIWRDLKTNGNHVLEVGKTQRGGLVFLCEAGAGCDSPMGTQCFPAEAVQVRPGNRNRRLYRRLIRALRADGLGGTVVVRGPRTLDPRRTTEVWYQAGAEETARIVSRSIAPVVGPVAPRPWAAGGPYRVTIIVGGERAVSLHPLHSRWN